MQELSSILYKNDFVNNFPGDKTGNLKPRQTPGMLYSYANPTPVAKPELIGWSDVLAKELGISKPINQTDIDVLGGNNVVPSMLPYAACYGGHQFGGWAGQLGDGRAIALGEYVSPDKKSWELQLKGAGPTAYSRRADGRAVLRSSVREYLMSEAMYHLGVPTTRALSLVSTGDQVLRDMFYNGNAEYEPGAIVMRVAPSFIRFGNFEILADRGDITNLRKLVDWTIERHYPHITGENRVLLWFKEIVAKTAALMVEWMRVGFVHGVMNTDNMSILGLTIDYGPYSFMDNFDPNFTPNTTDLPGRRYAFGRQPSIGYWNLGCLANAISPLFEQTDELSAALESYVDLFWKKYYTMIGNKLGLDWVKPEDNQFIADFEKALTMVQPDMTIFYQLLIDLPVEELTSEEFLAHFDQAFYGILSEEQKINFTSIMKSYVTRVKQNNCTREDSVKRMKENNPRFILRNYLLSQAIEELEKGENTLFLKLQEAIKKPYSNEYDEFFVKRPEWATKKAGCSMLSCSS